jgi:flagellar biosynthetic protein FliR
VAFLLIFFVMPYMTEAFSRIVDAGFRNMEDLYIRIGRQIGEAAAGGGL